MIEIEPTDTSSLPNSTRSGFKSVVRSVVTALKPWFSTISVCLSGLFAASTILVSTGSTATALETIEEAAQVDRSHLGLVAERLAAVEATHQQLSVLTPSVVSIAKDQGVIEGKVDGLATNVKLILDALLRAQAASPLTRGGR